MIYLDGREWNKEKFPNGETIYREIEDLKTITVKYESDVDIFDCYMLAMPNISVECIDFNYMPYARMDRKIGGYGFSLKAVMRLFNMLSIPIKVLDPHSKAVFDLGYRVTPYYKTNNLIESALDDMAGDFVVHLPDAGAKDKYVDICDLRIDEYSYGIKRRDLDTGEIMQLDIVGDVKDKNIIIVDDICSYGGTFALTYKRLKEAGAKKIVLCVTHCEDNILKGDAINLLDAVYTTDSIFTKSHNKIKVLNLNKGV